MNPILLGQIANLLALGIVELRVVAANNAMVDQYNPTLKLALTENRPLTDDELAPINALADSAHAGVQGA